MPGLTRDQLIKKIAHDVMERVAPEELPTFTGTAEAYFENPKRVLGTHKEDMLGFGLDAAIVYLTPFVLAITTDVIKDIVEPTIKEKLRKMITALIRHIFKGCRSSKDGPKIPLPTLLPEQRAQLRQRIREKARQLGLEEAKAELLADAVLGSLITIVDSQREAV
jgi:hypothetical protein